MAAQVKVRLRTIMAGPKLKAPVLAGKEIILPAEGAKELIDADYADFVEEMPELTAPVKRGRPRKEDAGAE